MPRIRKKTSKRISTHQRAKFKHKVAEGRKKKKKEAKKNPQWKSKKKKDPGIPNNFPYKDQILAEVAETRRQAEEAKQRRKQEKKAAREGLQVGETEVDDCPNDSPSGNNSSSEAGMKDEAPLLLNPDLPNLKAVLEKADVVLHVLDARDPASYRLSHIEALASVKEKTELVFVINKIDLVPREVLIPWMKHLRRQYPAFLFRSASSFFPKTPLNDPKAKGKAKESADDAVGADALLEYLGRRADIIQSESLQVAVVGVTNSGKSAIVNSLARKAAVPVYFPTSSTDAWKTTTTRAFEVTVEVTGHTISLIDTPGVSFEAEQDHDEKFKTRDMILRSRGRIDKVKDPVPALDYLVSRADTQDLMVHYNLPAFVPGDCSAFLTGVARSAGLLKKGSEADLTQAARTVLRDWRTGKLPFYTDAPKEDNATDLMKAETDEAPSLGELYARVDEVALVTVRMRREMRKVGGLVRFVRGEAESRQVVLDAPYVLEDGESESESGEGEVGKGNGEDEKNDEDERNDEDKDEVGEDEDEDEDEDDLEDGDSGDEEGVKLPAQPLTHKRKRKAKAAVTSAAPPSKKVTFAVGIQERQQTRSGSKPAIKSTSKSASKASKPPPRKASTTKVTAATAKTHTNKETNAYDFDQFFKL